MPLRGSVRFLLPSLRWRVGHAACFGACALVLAGLGAAGFRDAFPVIERDGLAQTLRQSAWSKALSYQSTPVHWPFEDLSGSEVIASPSGVPRLGLSASIRTDSDAAPEPVAQMKPAEAAPEKSETVEGPTAGDLALRDVEIGDSITFTAADGATCIYRVTGRPVVDPHLAGGVAVGEAVPFECGPLEALIMKATQAAQQPAPSGDQQKL